MSYIAGKQAFLEILKQEDVSVMFGNPGTTELPLMDGLAREPSIRYVLGASIRRSSSRAKCESERSVRRRSRNVEHR